MEAKDLIIGKWYVISEYGYSTNIRGKCVEVVGNVTYFKFFWGAPWRTVQDVSLRRIVGQCKRPGLFSNH